MFTSTTTSNANQHYIRDLGPTTLHLPGKEKEMIAAADGPNSTAVSHANHERDVSKGRLCPWTSAGNGPGTSAMGPVAAR